jgi:hypothetical protein
MTEILTQSRLRAFRSCQRLHDFSYQRGYRAAKDPAALRFGTLIHKGLECIWRDGNYAAEDQDVDPWDMARARPMLLGYIARWFPNQYEVLAVEEEFRVPLTPGWDLAGKFDAVVMEKGTGRVLVVEHKTSSQDIMPGSTYWQKLRLDSQLSIYWAGAKSKGYDIQGVLYDVLGKTKLRPKKLETPDQFEARVKASIAPEDYQRGEIHRLESELKEALDEVKQTVWQMEMTKLGGWSPRNPDNCEKWGRMCDYFPVCTNEEQLSNERLYQLNVDVHPELSGTAKEELPHGTSEASTTTA